MNYVLSGLAAGAFIGIPAEISAVMLMQNTKNNGIKSGISSGMGAGAAGLIWAAVSSVVVAFLSKYILKAEPVLSYAAGGIFIITGIMIILKKTVDTETDNSNSNNFINFMNGLMIWFTNKSALISFIYLYIFFGIGKMGFLDGLKLTGFTALGVSAAWILAAFIFFMIRKINIVKGIRIYCFIHGIVKIAMGMYVIISGILLE